VPAEGRPACPICGKEADPGNPARPFCSVRCKMVDLGRWFRGDYRVAGRETALPEDLEEGIERKEPDPGHKE
jgi:endogenous inhibitor of DNA gyrase (YacG/DUF329 family)